MMAKNLNAAVWTLFLSCAAYNVIATGVIQGFECFTDYAKELVCQWGVHAQVNCSEVFLRYYQNDDPTSPKQECVLKNGEDSSRSSTSNCTCTILPDFFARGLRYKLELEFNRRVVWNSTIQPASVVKPRAPKLLEVQQCKNNNFNLSWENSYSKEHLLYGEPVTYEVKYWIKQHPEEATVECFSYQTTSFEIFATQLKRGFIYVVSIRCKYPEYTETWSEWSNVAEFQSDNGITLEGYLQMVVPISCSLIMALILMCYFCFSRIKKEWWDQIPNPAKSHLVVKKVKGAQFSVLKTVRSIDEIKAPFPDVKQSHFTSCKNCLTRGPLQQSFKGTDNIGNTEKSCICLNKPEEWFPKGYNAVLTPETTVVEESLEISEYSTGTKIESPEEDEDQKLLSQSWESSANSFTGHIVHDSMLEDMFIAVCGTNTHDTQVPDFSIVELPTFENSKLDNSSQQTADNSEVHDQLSCDPFCGLSSSTAIPQDEYNCSAVSHMSMRSEDSCESGYQSSSTDTASPRAKSPPDGLHESHSPGSSDPWHHVLVSNQTLPTVPVPEITQGPAYKTFSSLLATTTEPCNPAYKSFGNLLATITESCNPACKSFSSLLATTTEPCTTGYKSFGSLLATTMELCNPAYKTFSSLLAPDKEPCNPAYKSLSSLLATTTEPCDAAYKSFGSLLAPDMEQCNPAYKSFNSLLAPGTEPCNPAYKSFSSLLPPDTEPYNPDYKSFSSLLPPDTEPYNPDYKSFSSLLPPDTEPYNPDYKSFSSLLPPDTEPYNPDYKSFSSLLPPDTEPYNPDYKSFSSLLPPDTEPYNPDYKSFSSLLPPDTEPYNPDYKSFSSLLAQHTELYNPAYKSFNSLLAHSPASDHLVPRMEARNSSLSMEEAAHRILGDQGCDSSHKPNFDNTCSENMDFPCPQAHAADRPLPFLPATEKYKQFTSQNVPSKTDVISSSPRSNPSSYQLSDITTKHSNANGDNDSKAMLESPYKPFTSLLHSNLKETLPGIMVCDSDLERGEGTHHTSHSIDSDVAVSCATGLNSREDLAQDSRSSPWMISSSESSPHGEHEDSVEEETFLHSLGSSCHGCKSTRTSTEETESGPADSTGEEVPESSNNMCPTPRCLKHGHLRKPGNAGESREMFQNAVSVSCSCAVNTEEESLNNRNVPKSPLERNQTAELLELQSPGEFILGGLFVDGFCPDFGCLHLEPSTMTPLVKRAQMELMSKSTSMDQEMVKLAQALAQEGNCYMKVA
ncbi:PREDICTED: interleukin-4 receptor subunit alpha [Gavialis gangeticus]|uniref:interleukin-4 receptor subunit alpha n=1 Tax=Gavialis gangeticus TaxID=94835 RepID=UPI00092FD0DB|nr:PREDICTED: interleukin-4 receptor subunit alpha [Gavialis gangeticus]XP_019368349.1 PREDICTED: interleukin-4 receptor subunit alpha [Gavialis gangeticus]XP_019368350.1 PREDICTED: interleukin-4 receptor subunit alpha [Gavialis gangeticus]